MTFSVRWFWNWKTWNLSNCHKSLFNWSARIKSCHCCLCTAHGSWLTALDASDRWFLLLALAVSCEGPRRLSCYYSTRGLPRHCPVTVTGQYPGVTSGHLVTRCLFSTRRSPPLSVTLGSGSVTWLSRDMLHSYVTCNTDPAAPQCHLFSSLELLISDPQEIIIRRPDRDHH